MDKELKGYVKALAIAVGTLVGTYTLSQVILNRAEKKNPEYWNNKHKIILKYFIKKDSLENAYKLQLDSLEQNYQTDLKNIESKFK